MELEELKMAKATAAMKLADIESAVVQLAEQLGTEFEGDEQVEQVLLTPPLSSESSFLLPLSV